MWGRPGVGKGMRIKKRFVLAFAAGLIILAGALAALLNSRPEAGIALALLHKAVRWVWLVGGLLAGAGGGLAKAAAKTEQGEGEAP